MFTLCGTAACPDTRLVPRYPAGPPRIGAGEAVVVIVIVTVAGVLTVWGIPQGQVLQLLASAGMLAVTVSRAWSIAPLRMVRSVLSASTS